MPSTILVFPLLFRFMSLFFFNLFNENMIVFGKYISQAYSPTEPLKPGDPLSKQNIAFDLSETRTDLPSTYQDLVLRYQVKSRPRIFVLPSRILDPWVKK